MNWLEAEEEEEEAAEPGVPERIAEPPPRNARLGFGLAPVLVLVTVFGFVFEHWHAPDIHSDQHYQRKKQCY